VEAVEGDDFDAGDGDVPSLEAQHLTAREHDNLEPMWVHVP